jgi:hypothetical protein
MQETEYTPRIIKYIHFKSNCILELGRISHVTSYDRTYGSLLSFPCSVGVGILRKILESKVGVLQHGGYECGCNEKAER